METKKSKYCVLFKVPETGRRVIVLADNNMINRLQSKQHVINCLTRFINQMDDKSKANEVLKLLDPIAIVAPAKFDDLKKYFDGTSGYEITSNKFNVRFSGAPVKDSILKLKSKMNVLGALRMEQLKTMN